MNIMEQCKQTKKRKMRLQVQVYLGYLLVCTLLLTGVSFSRYASTSAASDGARVAKGMVKVSSDSAAIVEMGREAGDGTQTKDFSFCVSNEQSEVAVCYSLTVKLDSALPKGVTIKLYKNDSTDPISTFDSNSGIQFAVPDAGVFEAGDQSTDQYKLTFVGDFNLIESNFKTKVSISVCAEQID